MNRRIRNIHFVGIGGVGMSGLAELLHAQGYQITGSDLTAGSHFTRLRELGLEVSLGHDRRNVAEADLVVASSAIRSDNPELEEARKRKIPLIQRAEMLAEIMRLKNGIAVGGSHGKTTTTSLIAHVLTESGLDPTSIVGGRVMGASSGRTGARLGRGEFVVAEADESDGSFLKLTPIITVVTNIDAEHLDHYGSLEAIRDAFVEFANGIPFWGLAVICIDDPGVHAIVPRLTRRFTTYGTSSQAELRGSQVRPQGSGMRFWVEKKGQLEGEIFLPLPGDHNVLNALACTAVALELEIPFDRIAESLANFAGVERRFETKGDAGGVRIVDDYAHHPAELRATLKAARAIHSGRIVAIFQPHRYSRTRDCMNELATAFNDSDLLIVSEVYAAGENAIPGINGQQLADTAVAYGHRNVRFISDLDEIRQQLPKELQAGDLVLTLGAGSISQLGSQLLETLARENVGDKK